MTTNANAPVQSPIQALHADILGAAKEGIKAGTASELCTLLVDGVVRAFDDVPMLKLVADNRIGRTALSLAIPYALALLCVLAPGTLPGGESSAASLRKVCLYAFQGHATFVVAPIMGTAMGRLKGTIRNVLSAAIEAQVIPADKAE